MPKKTFTNDELRQVIAECVEHIKDLEDRVASLEKFRNRAGYVVDMNTPLG